MRKIFTLVLAVMALCTNARQITPDEANAIASDFFNSALAKVVMPQCLSVTSATAQGSVTNVTAPYYVFNSDNNGFVIVSGDDRVPKIIGYSDMSTIDIDNLPPQLLDKLNKYSAQLESLAPEIGVHPSWNSAISSIGDGAVVLPTALWGQGAPYNTALPQINGESPVTGCVATAMAIIMKYHNYPECGRKTNTTYANNGQLETLDFSNEHFNFAEMKESYEPDTYTDMNVAAVAQLMKCTGVATGTCYGVNESSAHITVVSSAFQRHFIYSASVHEEARSGFNDEKWFGDVKADIDAGRPVLYYGCGTGSHAFVIDGYSKEGACHINWGWDGNANGFFYLDALTPASYDFNGDQGAIFGIVPGTSDDNIWSDCFLADSRYFDGFVDIHDFNVSVSELKQAQPFDVSTALISYPPGFGGEVGVALINESYIIKEIVYHKSISDNYSNNMIYGVQGSFMGCEIKTSKVEEGDRLILVTKEWGENEWKLIKTRNHLQASTLCSDLKGDFAKIKWNIDPRLNLVIGGPNGEVIYDWGPDQHNEIISSFLKGSYFSIRGGGMNESKDGATAIRVNGELTDVSSGTYPALIWLSLDGKELTVDIVAHTFDQDLHADVRCDNTETLQEKMQAVAEASNVCHITNLKVSGDINVNDLKYIRNNLMFIRNMDLSACTIKAFSSYEENEMPEFAFYGLTKLRSLKLPEKISKIGEGAFAFSSISYLTLPASVKEIGNSAFFTLVEPLKAVYSKAIEVPVYNYSFNSPENTYLYVTPGSKNLYQSTGWNTFKEIVESENPLMEEVIIEIEGVKYELIHNHAEITGYVDEKCPKEIILQSAVEYQGISYPVTAIRYRAFLYNKIIEKITIPESITEIASGAFACTRIEEAIVNAQIKCLNNDVFGNSYFLKRITLPESLEEIGQYAISEGFALEYIYIPGKLKNISINGIMGVSDFKIELNPENQYYKLYNGALYTANMDRAVLVPHGEKNKKIIIPEGVKYLNWGLFYSMPQGGEVLLPSSLVELSYRGFWSYHCMDHFEVPDNVTGIGDGSIALARNVTIGKKVGAPHEDINIVHGTLDNAFCYMPYGQDSASVFLTNYSSIPIDKMLGNPLETEQKVNVYTPYLSPNFSFSLNSTKYDVKFFIPGRTVANYDSSLNAITKEMWEYHIYSNVKAVGVRSNFSNLKIEKVMINGSEVLSANNLFHYESDTDELSVEVVYTINDYKKLSTTYPSEFNAIVSKSVLAETLTLSHEIWSGDIGDKFELTASVLPSETTDRTVKWSSSDENIATVDSLGIVTLHGEGTCVITVKTNDLSDLAAQCIINGKSGIDDILVDSTSSIDVYSLTGVRLMQSVNKSSLGNLIPGVYVVRQGEKVHKVVIR